MITTCPPCDLETCVYLVRSTRQSTVITRFGKAEVVLHARLGQSNGIPRGRGLPTRGV